MLENSFSHSLHDVLKLVIPDLSSDYQKSLTAYYIDSFDLMTLRSLLEEKLGMTYQDTDWVSIQKIEDFVSKAQNSVAEKFAVSSSKGMSLTREYQLNMPQLSVNGLSEYWYLKEVGDMHWRMIARSLGVASDQILDAQGNRLYATFVRITYSASSAFSGFKENDHISLHSELSRFGNFFISHNVLKGPQATIKSELVTSFVARGESNTDLYKSVPVEEVKNELPIHTEIPELLTNYHQVRKLEMKQYQVTGAVLDLTKEPAFQSEFQLDPYLHLNGVGLLYFAAYPHIFDVCERNFANGKFCKEDWALSSSLLSRDIFYLGNTNLNNKLIFQLRDYAIVGSRIYMASELIRQSDSKRVSLAITCKEIFHE